MRALIEVMNAGLGNTIQDNSRFGYRHQGVPVSGFLDRTLAQCANALVGNSLDLACIEIRALGPTINVKYGPALVALSGNIKANLIRSNSESHVLMPWCSVLLFDGDSIHIQNAEDGCAYFSVSGGIDVPLTMGSRSTYARVGLGGLEGRALRATDSFQSGEFDVLSLKTVRSNEAFKYEQEFIRVILGPQQENFTPQAILNLSQFTWETTFEQDRMGIRLKGGKLEHLNTKSADIASDGIAPGSIQVPGSGEPILLLADCQTMGGYPKIATVISADLHLMAHMCSGTKFRFSVVTLDEAYQALLDLNDARISWLQGLRPYQQIGFIDDLALYKENLISGIIWND